ncbi:Mannose-binding lectin superfamily protein [Arabidopsis thaliana]|uniref:Mannose-binding lectin superfamily protein n=1 Tax=Arabidopsis thaliana TaxID=3702 RepID=F4HTI1_ARATH|nr:Mannose-binding lectin superfamily protein [Arabidopsis thaliana]AEE33806.1 Mannose-binding lectin superfamily protein [Arabidopsis thaliana]|eukprot:NP_176318.3 Mannose-binding lectin superfamily protein [Arabidopsis thaliana]
MQIEIDHLNNEHLESVESYYDDAPCYIQALQFKTNFKVSELIGYGKGTKFSLSVKGKIIIGFHGYIKSQNNPLVKSLGAYFTWIPDCRLEAKGSKGGIQWDDGADHEGITKIHVRGGFEGIQYIKFDYVKSGQPKIGSVHGLSEGYYDDESTAIQALQFKTNIKTSELLGYEKGKKFSLADKGKKIIGFHGYAEKNLISLGAYFTTVSVTKSVCHGSKIIESWDDGVFDGIRKVYVSYSINHVACITFEYISNHSVVKRQHGNNTSLVEEFELNYPNEFITSVDGTFKNSGMRKVMCVTSLVFKTSKGRISPTYGSVTGTKFVLETKDCALAGFHGWTFLGFLTAIGAYFSLLPCPPNAEKLEARGYDRGAFWDDGVYDGVRKIYVGQCENGIAFLKFVYDKDTRMVIGDDHGNKTPLEVKELDLEYPGEYVTAVEGCYNKGIEGDVESITMLKFKTNKRTSISFGFESSSSFLLEKEGFKIVGFHGKASNMIHQLGVHVIPITH